MCLPSYTLTRHPPRPPLPTGRGRPRTCPRTPIHATLPVPPSPPVGAGLVPALAHPDTSPSPSPPQPPVGADLVPALVPPDTSSSPSLPSTTGRGRPCACPPSIRVTTTIADQKNRLDSRPSKPLYYIYKHAKFDSPSGSNPTKCRGVRPGIRVIETLQVPDPVAAASRQSHSTRVSIRIAGLPHFPFPFRQASLPHQTQCQGQPLCPL